MWICHLFLIVLGLAGLSAQDAIAPIYTPDNEMIKNQQDKFESKSGDNMQLAEIMLPTTAVSPPPANHTSQQKAANGSNSNKQRKRKYQNNKQYRPNVVGDNQPVDSSLALWANALKKNQINDLQNSLLIQLLANQKAAQAVGSQQHEATVEKYSPLISTALANNDLPIHVAPIFTVEPPATTTTNDQANQLAAAQLYMKQLAHLAALRKQSTQERSERSQEKPRLQKRVSNQPSLSSSAASNLYLNQLMQMQMQNQPQPIYSFFPNQQPASSQATPLFLALQPSFPASYSPSAPASSNSNQRENGQMNALIETGDKIYAKVKQWSTDVFNPKSSLNRQINEVLSVVSDVALVTLIGVPVISLLTLGVSSLVAPLSQLSNRKLVDRKTAATKQKTKEEKKDKDEKTAKSDSSISQKNTKMLDKRSRLVSIMERAGDEFTHFKNIVEIAKNFELAFKKYNVDSRECKYRILCEVGSASRPSEAGDQTVAASFLSSNLLREGRAARRQTRSVGNRVSSFVSSETAGNQLKTIDCEQQSNCSKSTNQTASSAPAATQPTPAQTPPAQPAKESSPATTFLQNQLKHFERMASQRGGPLRNLIRSFNLDKFINENREGFIGFATTIDQLLNRAHRSNFFSYLLNEEQFNQAFRSDSKLFKTISERSKQLQDKLRDFLDNLTLFQQVVSKESATLDSKASKYKMLTNTYYNLRSKRTANLNGNDQLNNHLNETSSGDAGEDDANVDVSGLRSVLVDLVHQLKFEQNQENLIQPLSKIWLSPYLSAFEYGFRHTPGQCKSRYFKCTTNFIGLNSNSGLARRLDMEISEISNNHLKQAVKKKPEQPTTVAAKQS